MSADHFSELVAEKLQHYVYRLIDPRTGSTFYVGRGQGDRVFSHAAGQLGSTADEDSLALKAKIREIRNAGFEVQHIAPRDIWNLYSQKRVPAKYRRRGAAFPIRYIDPDADI